VAATHSHYLLSQTHTVRTQSIKWWFTESDLCASSAFDISLFAHTHTSHLLLLPGLALASAWHTHFFRLSTCLSITPRSRPKSPFVAVGRSSLARERAILVPWHLSSEAEKTMCALCLRTKAGVKNAAARHTPVLNFGVGRQGIHNSTADLRPP
jgi:hypothetical protein